VDLDGAVALVTGASGGLGSAVTHALAARGVRVAIGYSSSKGSAERLAIEIDGLAVRADIADERAVIEMVEQIRGTFGPIDLLVNNAAVTTYVPHDDVGAIDASGWRRILDVNVVGAWSCIRAIIPDMRAKGRGSIVNIASDSAFTLEGSSVPYVASKTALVAVTQMLAGALAPSIRVNAVAPGWMLTPWLDRYVPKERADELRGGHEPTVPVDVAASEVVRLLADEATTGAVIRLDPA
jgi:NAD(P)-dependent dehydrogenase (short-subunit alcohol dehydrogenase family)